MPAEVIMMQPDTYLTGRRQFRETNKYTQGVQTVGEFVLVLQVEKAVFTPGRDGRPGAWKCYWFDATPADVGKDELA